MSDKQSVRLELEHAKALVLFELLSRIGPRPPEGLFEHPAEQRVLDDMLCVLEELLSDPMAPDYRERLLRARDDVVGS